MPLTLAETPLYYKDSQGQYHRIMSGADMTGYYSAAEVDALLNYQAGETYSNTTMPAFGDVSGAKKNLDLMVVLPKAIPPGRTITITKLLIAMRIPAGGYIESLNYDAFANATVRPVSEFGNVLRITCTRNTDWYETNNIPVCGTINVTMTFA